MFIRGPPAVLIFRRRPSPCRRLSTGGGKKYTAAGVQGSKFITDPGGLLPIPDQSPFPALSRSAVRRGKIIK